MLMTWLADGSLAKKTNVFLAVAHPGWPVAVPLICTPTTSTPVLPGEIQY